MSTVASRTFRSSPYRDSAQTWIALVELLTRGREGPARQELLSVSGVASSLIADRAPAEAAVVVVCEGTRTRLYCIYDEDAIDGSDTKEDALGYDPLQGEWSLSLPCPADDLPWVAKTLQGFSSRITARDMAATLGEETRRGELGESAPEMTVDREAFLKS